MSDVGVRSGDDRRLPHLSPLRGDLRARARGRRGRAHGDEGARRRRRRLQPRASSARRASSIKELHDDPDRVRTPLVKQADGTFAPATWDEAFAVIDRPPAAAILEARGRDAVGAYIGNPAAHSLAVPALRQGAAEGARAPSNIFSASTVDQYPKQAAVGADVRHRHDDRDPRPRPHRLPALPRRQPAGLQRLADDRARRARAAARDPRRAAGRSSSSTRAARAPRRRPTSTWRSARAPTRCC